MEAFVFHLGFLLVAVLAYLHAFADESLLLLVQLRELRILDGLQLGLISLFLQLHQFSLDFEHVEAISR